MEYGGRNDRALWLVQECGLEEAFILRALKATGDIRVNLICNDIFTWACADVEELPDSEWLEFEKSLERTRDKFNWGSHEELWFAAAWSVKLREVAPQKPATDRYPAFVRMLDFLEVPWRQMKRYDQMTDPTP